MIYSKLLLFVIAGLIAVSYNVGAFAEESGITYDVFDNQPIFFGDNLLIASTGKSVNGIQDAGSISVIDVDTNSLLYTINNPEPTKNDRFGRNIAISDDYIIVGMQRKTPVYGTYISAGIYVFDGKTGTLLHTIKNPDEDKSDIKFHSTFGRNIGTLGDNIVAGSYFSKSDDSETNLIHVFNGKTGSLLYTINSPVSNAITFGQIFESFDNKLAVHTMDETPNDNLIHVFDGETGASLYTIDDTRITTDDYARITITIVNDNIVVGVPVGSFNNQFSGTIHVFEGNTGSLLFTINDPKETESNFDMRFGEYVVPAGNNIAVRSSETVYIFEGSTGELLHTVEHPSLSNVELAILVDSFDDAPDNSFIILVAVVVFGGIVLSVILFRKRKK